MRVLASLFHPRGSWPFSGSERRFCAISEEWARNGVEVTALEPEPFAGARMEAGYAPVAVPVPDGTILRQWMAWVPRAVERGTALGRASAYDVVYATNNNLFNLLVAARVADRLSLPCVVVVHHLRWIDYRGTGGRPPDARLRVARYLGGLLREGLSAPEGLFRAAGAWQEANLLEAFDGFTSVSRTVADQLGQLVPPEAIHVAGNALSQRPRAAVRADGRSMEALFVGRLDEGKGVRDLPRAWDEVRRTLPGARLSIVGEGVLRAHVRRDVQRLGLDPVVRVPGFLDDSEVEALRSRSRLFLTLSRTEGFGIAVGEALQDGLPVVAWDLPPLREVFGGCRSVFLCPDGDLRSVAERASDLMTMPDERWSDLSSAARAYAGRFSWHDAAMAELRALEQTVGV